MVKDNGHGGDRAAHHQQSLYESTRQVRSEAEALASTVGDVAGELEGRLRDSFQRRPYATLAVAAGAGYVLGGGIPSKLTRVVLGLGARAAAAALIGKVVADFEGD